VTRRPGPTPGPTRALVGAPPPWDARRIEPRRHPAALDTTDDARLVDAVGRRDHDALAEAYRRHADACFGLARRVLVERTLAEEIVQEVYLRLWNEPGRFDAGRGSLRSFLLAQVHGRAVDLLRAETARRNRETRDARRADGALDDIERRVLDLAHAEAVRDALATLDPRERDAIELAYFGGHSYRDVATLLEVPEGTVKSRIRAGLHRLRASLIDAGYTNSAGYDHDGFPRP
jgi:RNA polymerase sigma-70 factor (ECF subfamily)